MSLSHSGGKCGQGWGADVAVERSCVQKRRGVCDIYPALEMNDKTGGVKPIIIGGACL